MNDTIPEKELLERIVVIETKVKLVDSRYRKIRKLFTKVVILSILVLATLIVHVYLRWSEYGR